MSPAEFARAEAVSYDYQGFGYNTTTGARYLQVHDDLTGRAGTFNSLAIRRDSTAGQSYYNSYTIRMTVMLSNAATTASTISANFDANHGANKRTVVADKDINFPKSVPGFVPSPFAHRIPFDTSYTFNGSSALCWEARISNMTNALTTYYYDAASSSSTSPALAVTPFGVGCRHSAVGGQATASGSSSMSWPNSGTLYLSGSSLPPNTVVFAGIGVSRAVYNGLPLPFLFPGSLYAFSGPCNLYTALQIVSFASTTTSGTSQFQVPIPAKPSMHGFHAYAQFIAQDPNAENILGLITSNGVEYNWVAPFGNAPVSRVYASTFIAPTGTSQLNFGYVVELR